MFIQEKTRSYRRRYQQYDQATELKLPQGFLNLNVSADIDVFANASKAVDGDPVANWLNQARDTHVEQLTPGRRPELQKGELNGKPGIWYDNIDDALELESGSIFAGLSDFGGSVFIVYRTSNPANTQGVFHNVESSDDRFVVESISNEIRCNARQNAVDNPISTAENTIVANTPYLVEFLWDGSTAQLYVNGTSHSLSVAPLSASTAGCVIGNRTNFAQPLEGHIFQVILYSRLVLEYERLIIQEIMRRKWGLQW